METGNVQVGGLPRADDGDAETETDDAQLGEGPRAVAGAGTGAGAGAGAGAGSGMIEGVGSSYWDSVGGCNNTGGMGVAR